MQVQSWASYTNIVNVHSNANDVQELTHGGYRAATKTLLERVSVSFEDTDGQGWLSQDTDLKSLEECLP